MSYPFAVVTLLTVKEVINKKRNTGDIFFIWRKIVFTLYINAERIRKLPK